ncbi:right-handed parallel beta-helix repeat-containing protein [Paenibacillus alginolyticus]|uniref:Right-handed parallel beta-helix repeat-containing protein n=1 Tax=Paenibacillus alginolyticus TaxID=59839 RepID=A0ABT4G8W6_9BACL|nr:right-handed parallel beta-helix repeat-containing protein [Paenibacillus alginolyticus]MCY9692574.1 right-handed parallel beta-helix repeat-containing protein [Paenibacillus alginolyticus]MEC0143780.1 right-handed parallel beta-helix repeat-containing protein [Paenibacillus alginolyticus]
MKKMALLLLLFVSFGNISYSKESFDIQNAINGLGVEGGTVEIPSGEFIITEPIVITKPNVVIKGQGPGTVLVNASNTDSLFLVNGSESSKTEILSSIMSEPDVNFQNNPVLTAENVVGFSMNDHVKIIQEGTPVKTSYNYINKIVGNDIFLKENEIEQFVAEGSLSLVKVDLLRNVTIKDVKITSAEGKTGYGIKATHTNNFRVENVDFSKVGRNAIVIEDSLGAVITNNTFFENGRPGLGDNAIHSIKNFNIVISYNQLTRSGSIHTNNNMFSSVDHNKINGTQLTNGDGIYVIGGIGNRYEYNTVLRANCYGIWLRDGAERNIIANNQFIAAITSGIHLTDSSNNIIKDNVSQNNAGNGIFLTFGSKSNIVENNLTTENYGRGILVHDTGNLIKNNVSRSNQLHNYFIEPGNTLKENEQ